MVPIIREGFYKAGSFLVVAVSLINKDPHNER
jgi:hypothetical protein